MLLIRFYVAGMNAVAEQFFENCKLKVFKGHFWLTPLVFCSTGTQCCASGLWACGYQGSSPFLLSLFSMAWGFSPQLTFSPLGGIIRLDVQIWWKFNLQNLEVSFGVENSITATSLAQQTRLFIMLS